MVLNEIRSVVLAQNLDYSHYTLARFIKDAIPDAKDEDLWISFLLSIEVGKGNVCLDLSNIEHLAKEVGWQPSGLLKDLESDFIDNKVIGLPAEHKPLIFDRHKLYLNRYYHYEKLIAESLVAKLHEGRKLNGSVWNDIDTLFDVTDSEDYQRLAVMVCLQNHLGIISGGPGTGKTYTVSKLLALLLMQNNQLKIKLAAPTGKAAARLSESVKHIIPQLALPTEVAEALPTEALTLHRLLGIHRFTHRPRFYKKLPLDCDVLVLDEASMIDQQMMAMTCAALRSESRLILLGDKDQLSSVEAGSVFADLCGGLSRTEFDCSQQEMYQQLGNYTLPLHESGFKLANNVVFLEKSHRFNEQSGIGQLAHHIKKGNSVDCMYILQNRSNSEDLTWRQPKQGALPELLIQQVGPSALKMTHSHTIAEAFQSFKQLQVLAAVWQGPYGVDSINRTVETWLKKKQALDPSIEFYQGKPLMMSANAYQFGIHNGDIGIVWPDQQDQLKVWFERGKNKFTALSLTQCPKHQSAYAMTVHKSQGSEFDHVILVLPESESALISRELVYTGITRAAQQVEIWAQQGVIERAIQQVTERTSGLMHRLTGSAKASLSSPQKQPPLF